jgi:hypothetical protein
MSAVASLIPQYWFRSPELPPPAPPHEETPNPVNAFKAIDAFLDLSGPSPVKAQRLQALNPAEQSLFMRHLGELLRFGIVGIETFDFAGQPRQGFAETTYADPALRSAAPHRPRLRTPLDLRA